ncbi:MAG: squalene/phytoene synthase family protein [Caulobacteraceae bacterium]
MTEDLDAQVRRADPDRWLASRFAPSEARAGLVALYAFDQELARVAGAVTQQLMGEIRLAWWRENLDSLFEDGPRRHPVLDALSGPVRDGRIARDALETMIEYRM